MAVDFLDARDVQGCFCGYGDACICPATERALREAMAGQAVPFTDAERAAITDEITKVEGYSIDDCDGLGDADLARTCLSAWTDYCRDKGML